MSCWVVPSVAAELWGVSVDTILEKAKLGIVASKVENGFTFVDMATVDERCDAPEGLRDPRPPTFSIVTEEELVALAREGGVRIDSGDWREARKLAGKSRKPPAKVTP